MRRSSKLNHNKKVSVLNEDEAERVRRIEGKKEIIRAEFEKHKKELAINVSEASKMNEIRLRSQLEELLNINAKKMKDLERMNNVEQDLERFNFESTQFFDTVSRFEVSKHSDAFLAVGSHPNRTTTMINDLKGDNAAEKLGEKMAQLMEMLSNVELLLEEEEEVYGNVYEKYEETKKDQLLLSKKVNELTKIYDHAGKRFTDLQRIEFLAQNKHAAATSDLKELKDELKELKDKEYAYKKQKEEEKRRETEFLHAKQNEMSHILIDIDKKRQEYLHSEEEIKRLDMKFEEMRDKRKNNRIVTKYIETLNALAQKSVNLLDAHQALKDLSKTLDASSPYKAPAGSRSGSAFNFNMDGSPSPPRSDPPESRHQKRGSVLDRNFYIDKIQRLYEQHPEGPQRLADALISEYNVQCRHEESLKSNYEELQQNKRRQEFELQSLEEELQQLKGKNEYITLGKSGSKILDSNEQEAIDSGMMIVDAVPTTLNQAKFDFENKKDADGNATLFTNTEAFVMRCYMDSIEMVSRFSKLLNSIYNQSGGHVSEDMKEIVKLAHAQINTLRRAKKMKPELSTSQFISEPYTEFHRTITDNSSVSERDKEPQEPIVTLDINDVYSLFLSVFDMEEEKGTEFIENIKSDVMIITFISLDDIKNYLQTCQSDHSIELNVQRALANTHHLRKVATENMMQRFETIYKLYTDTVTGTRQGTRDLLGYLMARGVDIPKEDVMAREDETNPFIKKAIHKKWQNLLDRYDYDPNRDYRKDNMESERSDHNVAEGHRERVEDVDDMNGEDWDREDTKAKLNEIVGALSKKQAFKGKNEEDQKRLQAKKDKERQKQALENMTDEDFLDWQRKQIKKDGRDDFSVTEVNEGELLRKAQADQALRLSSSAAPIEELKRMIENSRVLSKIQILEKQKSLTDGKRTIKFEPTDNYIPHDPIKVPRSPTHSVNNTYNIRITRNVFTPSNKPGSRFWAASSDRMTESEYDNTPKDMSFKTGFPKSASKFKPVDANFDLNSEPTLENEKPKTQVGGKRLRTLDNFKAMPSLLSKPATTQSLTQNTTQSASKESKKKSLLLDSSQKRKEFVGEVKVVKHKGGKSSLPKLEKIAKRKKDKKKKRSSGDEGLSLDHETLNHLLKIQTDPLLKMVYSPSYFATSVPSSAYTSEDLGYRFDSYKFNTPGLLISEKL